MVKGEPTSELNMKNNVNKPQGEGLYSGKLSKVVIPISEPLDRPETNPGEHWTVAVINCRHREVCYFNSLTRCGQFSRFKEVSKDFLTCKLQQQHPFSGDKTIY